MIVIITNNILKNILHYSIIIKEYFFYYGYILPNL